MPLTLTEYIDFQADSPLAGVRSHTWAWKVIDYTALRRRTRVGENRPIPGVPGRLWVPKEWDEQTVVLTWKINGTYDKDGGLYDDAFEGVDVNHQYLLDNLVNSLDLRAVVFHRRDDTEHAGDIEIVDWEPSVDPSSGGDQLLAPLTIKVPDGWLEPVGS